MKRIGLILATIVLMPCSLLCQTVNTSALNLTGIKRPDHFITIDYGTSDYLDNIIEEIMEQYNIPGAATIIVSDDEIIWNSSYGYANVEQNKEVTGSTTFYLASVSKTVTLTALMQLWEDGLFELDENINKYLPLDLQVVNPDYPNDDITFRHLLTHTSSIDDDWFNVETLTSYGSNSPITLGSFLKNYLMEGGRYYHFGPFNPWAPGTKYEYSNEAIALAGYLVEILAETSFANYCHQKIFDPLGMIETSWSLSGLNIYNIAVPYYYSESKYNPFGHRSGPTYPAGGLRTSSAQLAHFMTAYMNGGEFDGVRILDSNTIDTVLSTQLYKPWPGYGLDLGLIWFVSDNPGEVGFHNYRYPTDGLYYGHAGHTPGSTTFMDCYHNSADNFGVVVLTNGDSEDGRYLIRSKLHVYALLYNKIYPKSIGLNSAYMQVGIDTLTITTEYVNPHDHQFTTNAIYLSIDSTIIDTVPLFDDGIHGDGLAEDGIWGNYILPISGENEYMINVSTTDLTNGYSFDLHDLIRFSVVGVQGYQPERYGLLNIYPNPVHEHLTIETVTPDQYSVDIASLNGQLVYSTKMEGTSHQIDLSSFQKGVYFITIRSMDFITTRKIIKL